MGYFYSPSTGGFYCDAIHGPRTVLVADPAWRRPEVDAPDPEHPDQLIKVPDMKAEPPLIEVPNDQCKVPADAKPISDEEHAALMAEQALGKRIVAGAGGDPVAAAQEPPTPDQQRAELAAVVQKHLDDAARALGYDDIRSAVTYADEPAVPRFQKEGASLRAWRSLVWARCYELLAEVQAGKRGAPSAGELLSELPAAP